MKIGGTADKFPVSAAALAAPSAAIRLVDSFVALKKGACVCVWARAASCCCCCCCCYMLLLFSVCAGTLSLNVVHGACCAGGVLVQNNAGSTVGQAVIVYAASKGIKTVNIMRARDNWDDMVKHLQGLGATLVVKEDFAQTPVSVVWRVLRADARV